MVKFLARFCPTPLRFGDASQLHREQGLLLPAEGEHGEVVLLFRIPNERANLVPIVAADLLGGLTTGLSKAFLQPGAPHLAALGVGCLA